MTTATVSTTKNRRLPNTLPLVAGIVLAFGPNLVLHFQALWEQEQYQYFPFVIAAIIWIGSSRWVEATPRSVVNDRFTWVPYLLLAIALPLLCLSIYSQWPWLTAVAFNLTVGAGIVHITRYAHVRNAWGIWLLFWLLTPPPIEFGVYVVQQLQLLSSTLSSKILDLLRINHLMQGNVLLLPSRELFVDEACSGIVSVMSVIAIVAIYAVWQDRPLVHFLLLGIIAIMWAVIMNTVRICAVAIAESRYSYDLAEGLPHDILGLILFSLTFLAVVSTDMLLLFFLAPIKLNYQAHSNPLIPVWNKVVGFMQPTQQGDDKQEWKVSFYHPMLKFVGAAFIGIGIWASMVAGGVLGRNQNSIDPDVMQANLPSGILPDSVDGWQLVGSEATVRDQDGEVTGYEFGKFSNRYFFERPGMEAIVSFDFPFRGGWHELSACYRAIGWTIENREVQTYSGQGGHVEADLRDGNDEYGFLLFSNFHANSHILRPATSAILSRVWFFVRRRLLREVARDVYQAQVMVNSTSPLTSDQKQQVRVLFRDCQDRFIGELEDFAKSDSPATVNAPKSSTNSKG